MQYEIERSKLNSLTSRFYQAKDKVDTFNQNKEKYREASKIYEKNKRILYQLEMYQSRLNKMLVDYRTEESEYKTSRLDFVESRINERISRIFPEENYTVKISFLEDNKDRVSFKFVDSSDRVRDMSISAGGMMQSTITYAVFITISEIIGTGIVWVDEGFSASDDERLDKVTAELRGLKEDGLQVWIVDHRAKVYENEERTDIILNKNLETGMVDSITYEKF